MPRMQPSQELLRGARGELLIFYQKEIACNTAGCRVSKKWLNATFSSFFHPVLAPMARSAPNAKNENLWVFIRSDAHVVRAGLNIRGCGPLSTPGFFDRLSAVSRFSFVRSPGIRRGRVCCTPLCEARWPWRHRSISQAPRPRGCR